MQNDTIKVLDTLRKTIAKYQMLSPNETVLVAVSGGADSVCLLHGLKTIGKEWNLQIVAAHLNHKIRGKEAERDAEFVRKLCRAWRIPCYQKTVDVPALALEMDVSEETAGRIARYQFFHELTEEKKINRIATAHNQDDQAETVLMRMIRGSGIEGLSGIRYVRADGVIRPLLDVSRTEIEGYLKENAIDFVTDSTNESDAYTRNKIRHGLLPMLKEEFNPNIVSALSAMAQNMAEDSDFIKGYTRRLYQRINSPLPAKKPVVLDIETMRLVEPGIRTRLLLYAVQDAMGKSYRLEHCHTEAVLSLLDKETGATVHLPGGLSAVVRYGWLAFETGREEISPFASDIQYEVELGRVYDLEGISVSVSLKEMPVSKQEGQSVLDYDKVKDFPLVIRTRRKGDRIAVFRDGRERKLKDFLIDLKVPVSKRDDIPLLCSGDKVLAVVGYRVAEPYKTDKNTKRGLVIQHG
ncbi:MAG: tRNA lysidine(34) synthetase TilS [Clostridia bacterium]|nr:tRNA lysidine(34) synthetase TilS [Clostridia bacterium]